MNDEEVDTEKWRVEHQRVREERRKKAEDFLKRDPRMDEADRNKFLNGMDFNHDVEIVEVRKGDVFSRWEDEAAKEKYYEKERKEGRNPDRNQPSGRFLAPPGSSEDDVGLRGDYRKGPKDKSSDRGAYNPPRTRHEYIATENFEMLRSRAQTVNGFSENQPDKNGMELYYGGGEQLFCHHEDRGKHLTRVFPDKSQSAAHQQSPPDASKAQQQDASQSQAKHEQADQRKRAKPPAGEYEKARKQARQTEHRTEEKAEKQTEEQNEQRAKAQAESREKAKSR